jgi:hypothetical protein
MCTCPFEDDERGFNSVDEKPAGWNVKQGLRAYAASEGANVLE